MLEHIEDDEAELIRISSILLPGGRILIFVPAHRFLMSRMDDDVGHFFVDIPWKELTLQVFFRRISYHIGALFRCDGSSSMVGQVLPVEIEKTGAWSRALSRSLHCSHVQNG